ncbi:hypothetical protein HK102_011307, partial [Quaeritorhiza haematococci]
MTSPLPTDPLSSAPSSSFPTSLQQPLSPMPSSLSSQPLPRDIAPLFDKLPDADKARVLLQYFELRLQQQKYEEELRAELRYQQQQHEAELRYQKQEYEAELQQMKAAQFERQEQELLVLQHQLKEYAILDDIAEAASKAEVAEFRLRSEKSW